MKPGPYEVGFRTVFRYDRSRTWAVTRNYKGDFSTDLQGRPIQANIWYPARRSFAAPRMSFADYVEQSSPRSFKKLNDAMRKRNEEDALASISAGRRPELLATVMQAHRNAAHENGSWPVVLYFGGLGASINSNATMAEYLASRGYIFVSISLLGPSDEQLFQSRIPTDLEATVRDMEFVWSFLQVEPGVDRTRIATMGHSVGAIEAVLYGMRNGNVSSVIGLDGTYGFSGLSSALTGAFGFDAREMRAHVFDIRRSQGAQGNDPLDLSAIESFHYADRTFVTIDRMHHSDFTSFALIGSTYQVPLPTGYELNGWDRQVGRTGYDEVCRLVLLSLNGTLKSGDSGEIELENDLRSTERIHVRNEPAAQLPPSPVEAARIAVDKGLNAAESIYRETCGPEALESCIRKDQFNQWGYVYLGEGKHREALMVFLLNVWAHPGDANLQDSLADGYIALADSSHAREALQKSIALAQDDPSLNAASRTSFIHEEQNKLERLK